MTRSRWRRSFRSSLFFVFSLVTIVAAGAGSAHAEAKRVGVVRFKGPGEGPIRAKIIQQLEAKKLLVVGQAQIGKTAVARRVKLDTDDEFVTVAKELGLSAWVLGEVTKKKVTIMVRDGATGSVSAEASWTGPNPRKMAVAVSKTFWKRLGGAIQRGSAPSGAKKAAVEEEQPPPDEAGGDDAEEAPRSRARTREPVSEDKPSDEDRPSKRRKPSDEDEGGGGDEGGAAVATGLDWLDIAVSPRAVMRALRYTNDQLRELPDYNLDPLGPQIALIATAYPLANSMSGFPAGIGLNLGYERIFGVTSKQGTSSYSTAAQTFWIGPRVRVFNDVYGTVQYGVSQYRLVRTGGSQDSAVPDADYRFVKIGAGGRFALTPTISLMVNAAYLHLLAIGELKSNNWFPRATGMGVEVGAGVGIRLTSSIEVRAGVDLRRFGFAFNVPGNVLDTRPDQKIAGGAVDQYVMLWAALAFVLGSEGPSGGGSSDAEPAAEEEKSEKPEKKAAAADDEDEEEDE